MVPKKVLFCSDFSENSEPAKKVAVEYAVAFGADLLLAHVVDWSGLPYYGESLGEQLDQILEHTERTSMARLEELAKECANMGAKTQIFCRTGLTAREIVSLANEQSADLIVLGTHGRTGVRHLVMGSVARSVLKTAHRPVLIVEAPAEKGETFEEPFEHSFP